MADKAINQLITIVVLKPSTPTAEQLIAALTSNSSVELIHVETPGEAVQLLSQVEPAIVIASLSDAKAVVSTMSLLKGIFPLAKKGRVKSLIISKLKNPQLRAAAQKLMISEFIEEPITARTLQFKANLQVKAVDSIKKRDAELRSQQELIELKKVEMQKAKEAYSAEAKMKPAVNVDIDGFTFRGSKVKKGDGKVSFDLGGPDPESGEWKEHKSAEEGKPQWRWVPKDPKELAAIGGAEGKDGCIADGQKPEFYPLKKKWALAGEKPGLGYFKDGRKVAVKAEVNAQGELEVAEDSPAAEEKVKKAIESQQKRAEEKIKNKKETALKDSEARRDAEASKGKKKAAEKNLDRLARMKDAIGEKEAQQEKNKKDSADAHEKKSISKKEQALEEAPGEPKAKSVEKESKEGRLLGLKNKLGEESKESKKDITTGLESEGSVEGEVKDLRADSAGALDRLKNKLNQAKDDPSLKNDLKLAEVEADQEEKGVRNKLNSGEEKKSRKESKLEGADTLAALRNRLGESEEVKNKNNHEHMQRDQEPNENKGSFDPKKKRINAEEVGEKKKKLEKQIEAEMNEPLPAKLSPEQRLDLEKELGVNKDSLSDKELARKAKLGRLKNLKKKLGEANLEIEESKKDEKVGQGALEKRDASSEDAGTQSQANSSFEELKARWQAQDSDQDEKEVDWKGHAAKSANPAIAQESDDKGRLSFYLANNELGLKQPAWEKAGDWYVCVDVETKYRGYKSVEELLPLWCFKGSSAPERLEKDDRWRFYDREPERFDELASIPIEVKDYLAGLKAKEENEADLREENANNEDEAIDSKSSALERLKSKLVDVEEKEAGDAFDIGDHKKKRFEQAQKDAEELRLEMNAIDEAAAAARPKKEDIEAQLEELRSKLEGPEKKPPPAEAPSVVDSLENKVKSSEAAEFLKKRKAESEINLDESKSSGRKHVTAALAAAQLRNDAKSTLKAKIGDTIAVSLIISDALFDGRNLLKAPKALLSTISDRFGNARATLMAFDSSTGDQPKVVFSSDGKHVEGQVVAIDPNSTDLKSLSRILKHQSTGEKLGAILLEPIGVRETFENSDLVLLEEIAKILSEYWTSLNLRQKGAKAA